MPPKKSEQLKRAAADLDEALNDSPVKKKKSKTNLGKEKAVIIDPVPPPPEVDVPDPSFIDRFEPEAALRLTKAANSISHAEDKINFYADLLDSFDNGRDDKSLAVADRANGKIEKWGARRAKIQKSMDVLMDIAPKKKAGAMISSKTADGFLSASDDDDSDGDVQQGGEIEQIAAMLSASEGEEMDQSIVKSEVLEPLVGRRFSGRGSSSKK